jgi:hypothetical protein
MNKAQPFLVNENPSYKFADLRKMPDTQLVMLIRKPFWARLKEYVEAFEALTLAGRFGAEPGDYEWEWINNPPAVRWWRRNAEGIESLCGIVLAIPRGELVELYGLVEIDETSPFWPDVIPEEVGNALPARAKSLARTDANRREEDLLADLYREFYRDRGMLTRDIPGESLRKGTVREVERFRDALKSLVERSTKATLPSEIK